MEFRRLDVGTRRFIMTTGSLSAEFEGQPTQQSFKTSDVQFYGLDGDTDFYLGAQSNGRSFGFYFPDADIADGGHTLAPDGNISAYYVVTGNLTWETLGGRLKISFDEDRVTIDFNFSAKEGGSGTGVIQIKGKGTFKGKTPWTALAEQQLPRARARKV
jgi:hypothetical protein